MKKLLVIFTVLLSLSSLGQNFKLEFIKADSAFCELFKIKANDRILKTDTILVKALCSYDYSYSKNYSELKSEPVFVTYLQQIRIHYLPYHPDYVVIDEKPTIKILKYLYENGSELSKIINIWQYKEIKK